MPLANRKQTLSFGRGRLAMLWLCLLTACTQCGCNYVVLAGYLLGGPPSIEPHFDVLTNQSMTDMDVKVAVVCYAPTKLKWDFSEIDHEIAKYVSFRLRDHEIKVVNPDYVRTWLDKNRDWDMVEEIGRDLDVTYVIYIDVSDYSLYEENSANLYRGRAEVFVSVFEMDESGEGDKIYTKELNSRFPILAPRATSDVKYETFKRHYLSRLSEEIGRLFYEHYNGDEIIDAT